MIDILLPRTDAGVTVQFVLATIVFATLLWGLRRNKDARILVIGIWLVTYGFMGVRSLH